MTNFVSGTFREQLPKSTEAEEDILRLALLGHVFPENSLLSEAKQVNEWSQTATHLVPKDFKLRLNSFQFLFV